MREDYLMSSVTARELYDQVNNLPVIDYHCHLSPREIYEDREFTNIGEIMLGGDHYKWRIMRAFGSPEHLVTGDALWRGKFLEYARALELAAGNPVRDWTMMELRAFFGIDDDLNPDTAGDIWERANAVIREKRLSPRKLIAMSGVRYICTTDDPADTLEYHKLIEADPTFGTTVTPAFRTDRALNLKLAGYPEYIARLAEISGISIKTITDLKAALAARLDFFASRGCKFSDIGLPVFPDRIGDETEAQAAFSTAVSGSDVPDDLYSAFLGHMYLFLAREYAKREVVMQWHLAVKRNVNSALFAVLGPDTGGDVIGDMIPPGHIAQILDAANSAGELPKTILYTLNPGMHGSLSGIAGSFPGVIVGAAWWFCDHRRGIRELCEVIAETGYLGSFLGMLTDSRSFLSYPRHDYFRRIFCDLIGEWVENGIYPRKNAERLVKAVAYENIAKLIGLEV